MSSLTVKKAARTIYGSARFAENFFIIMPAMLSDRSRTSDVKPFRFRNFQPRNEFSISMRLRTRLQFPRYDTGNYSPRSRARFRACIASIPMKFAM